MSDKIGGLPSYGYLTSDILNGVNGTNRTPVDDMAFALATLQLNNMDKELSDKIQIIKKNSSDLTALKTVMTDCKKFQSTASSTDDSKMSEMSPELRQWFDDYNKSGQQPKIESGTNRTQNYKEWQTTIDGLQAKIDGMGSQNEIDMLSIQSLMSKRGQSLELATSIMKKASESKDGILRNI